jgi:hypothetical protein
LLAVDSSHTDIISAVEHIHHIHRHATAAT